MQNDIPQLREQINQLDTEVVRLLNERAKVAQQIGEIKKAGGADIYDPARERDVLDHVNELNEGPLSKGAIEEIYATIMTATRELESS